MRAFVCVCVCVRVCTHEFYTDALDTLGSTMFTHTYIPVSIQEYVLV
jgi:hypothetical protein